MRALAALFALVCWSGTAAAAGQQPVTAGQSQQQSPTPPERPLNPGQEVAGEQPAGPAIDVGPAKLRFGGYLGVTGFYRSTSSGGGPATNFGTIPYANTLTGSVSETRLSAQSSRLSIRVDAPFPEARFKSLSGYIEMDFAGATPGNIAVTASSAGLRLRHAFGESTYGEKFSVAAGQAFSLMTPPKQQLSIWPLDYETSQAVDLNYLAGLIWDRAPQVRFTWRLTPEIKWAVSVENPEQQLGRGVVLPDCCADDIGVQYNTGDQALAVPNLMPDLVTRAAWNPSTKFHVDGGGVLRVFRHTVAPYDHDFKATGGGVSFNGHVTPVTGTRIIGQYATGAGLGRYVGGLAPDVVFREDGSIEPLGTTSWVVGLEQVISPRVSAAGYYSGLTVEDKFFVDTDGAQIGYGFAGSSQAANRRIDETTLTMSYQMVKTDNRGSAQMSLQTSWLSREPWSIGSGPNSAHAFMFFAQVRYNLP